MLELQVKRHTMNSLAYSAGGEYQMGELQARSLTSAGSGIGTPRASARWVVQRQVRFSNTRT